MQILIADSNELHRRAQSELLRSEGYTVREASNGSEVINLCGIFHETDSPLRLLILDLGLSDPPLTEVQSTLRDTCDAPVILLWDGSDTNLQDLEMRYRFSLFMLKPLHPEELLINVKNTIQSVEES